MPLIDSNDPAVWASLYSLFDIDPETGWIVGFKGYERSVKDRILGPHCDQLIDALEGEGLTPGQRIALVGCGFGWLSERLIERGYGPIADGTSAGRIVNIDTSTWIHANKASNAVVEILNENINAATGRRALRQALGSNNVTIDWGISEDILPILSGNDAGTGNNEYGPFASSMRQLATNVVHWVTTKEGPDQDQRLNWKTLENWKALMSPDLVVERQTGRLL